MRNPSSTRFTLRKNHFSGFIQRRLGYIFISSSVQDSVQNIDVLTSFCNDHSLLLLSHKKRSHSNLGQNFWKFNCSLIRNELSVLRMKKHIENIISSLDSVFNHPMKREFLRYEVRKFTISFSENETESMREKKLHLEKKLKLVEGKLNCNEAKDGYNICKENLGVIYDEIANGIKIRSRCGWYELGEKSNKFFLNLQKYRASHNSIRKVIHDAQEITDHKKVNNHIFSFYKKRSEERQQNDSKKLLEVLNDIPTSSLTGEQKKICEGKLTKKEIYQSLIIMESNKSPGNDGLTKEFYCSFWNEIKNIFINRESRCLKALSTSQR